MHPYLTSRTFIIISLHFTGLLCMEPTFDMPMVNVTVKEFTTAILPCAVKFLGDHQVVWTDVYSTLLSFEDRRIIDDERMSIERPFSSDWNLHIRNVQYEDQGSYHCQINTVPVKFKTVNLRVEVPAKIIDHLSTSDITVREHDDVTLVCNVTGVPLPHVTWYRHVTDLEGVQKQKVGVNGEVLVIHNISRYCGDTYECVAFNGVPPAVNRLFTVEVQFPPEIIMPNKRIGQVLGRDTILECAVTSAPFFQVFWTRHGEVIETKSEKYEVNIYDQGSNELTLDLRIYNLERQDFGVYTCTATNALGKDTESMTLYEYSAYIKTTPPPTTTTTTTTTTTMSRTMTRARWFRTTQNIARQHPATEADPYNSLYPPMAAGRDPQHSRPGHTYSPDASPDHWGSPQEPVNGSGGKVLQSNMGGESDSSSAAVCHGCVRCAVMVLGLLSWLLLL